MNTLVRTEEMSEILDKIEEWLKSDSGQMAVIDAVEKSLSEVQELNKARRLEQDQLNIPITL